MPFVLITAFEYLTFLPFYILTGISSIFLFFNLVFPEETRGKGIA